MQYCSRKCKQHFTSMIWVVKPTATLLQHPNYSKITSRQWRRALTNQSLENPVAIPRRFATILRFRLCKSCFL